MQYNILILSCHGDNLDKMNRRPLSSNHYRRNCMRIVRAFFGARVKETRLSATINLKPFTRTTLCERSLISRRARTGKTFAQASNVDNETIRADEIAGSVIISERTRNILYNYGSLSQERILLNLNRVKYLKTE